MRWIWSHLSSLNINFSFLSESKLFWRLERQLIGLKRTETVQSSLFSCRPGLERPQLRRRLFAFAVQQLIFKASLRTDPPGSLLREGRQNQMLQSGLWSYGTGQWFVGDVDLVFFIYILEFLLLKECYEHCWQVPTFPCRVVSENKSGTSKNTKLLWCLCWFVLAEFKGLLQWLI